MDLEIEFDNDIFNSFRSIRRKTRGEKMLLMDRNRSASSSKGY